MKIEVRNNNVEKALRKLKKKMFDGGAIKDLMDRRYYEKPSAKRRRKKLEAANRYAKEAERQKMMRMARRPKLHPKKVKEKKRFTRSQ